MLRCGRTSFRAWNPRFRLGTRGLEEGGSRSSRSSRSSNSNSSNSINPCIPGGMHLPSRRAFGHRVQMILKEDVPSLGYSGDQVSVRAGFGRNFLYPQKKAVYATEQNIAKFRREQEKVDSEDVQRKKFRQSIVEKLAKSNLEFKRHVTSPSSKSLYGSVSAQNIIDALEAKLGIVVGSSRLVLEKPIKTLGTHQCILKLGDTVEQTAVKKAEAVEELELSSLSLASSDEENSAQKAKPRDEIITSKNEKTDAVASLVKGDEEVLLNIIVSRR